MKLLFVDSNIHILRLYREEFEEAGYDVLVASTGREALRKFEKEDPGIVVLELLMPDVDGLTLMRRMKSRRPDIPVLITTAFDYTDAFAGAAADGFIVKSSDLSELQESIHLLMSEKSGKAPDVSCLGVAACSIHSYPASKPFF